MDAIVAAADKQVDDALARRRHRESSSPLAADRRSGT